VTPPGEMFRLLSECYIHGVMDGEVMQSPQSKRMERFEMSELIDVAIIV